MTVWRKYRLGKSGPGELSERPCLINTIYAIVDTRSVRLTIQHTKELLKLKDKFQVLASSKKS